MGRINKSLIGSAATGGSLCFKNKEQNRVICFPIMNLEKSILIRTKPPKVQIEFYASSKCVACLFIEAALDKKFIRSLDQNIHHMIEIKTISMFVPRLAQTLDHVLYLELKFVQNFLLHTEKKKHIFKEYIHYK